MSNLILTPDELQKITHRVKYAAQIRQLQRMGIEYKRAADGAPIVSRLAFEQAMGVKQQPTNEPKLNLDFLK